MRLTFSMVLISMFAVSLMIVASPFSAVAKASAVVTSVSFPSASAAVGSSVMHKASAMRQLKTRFFMVYPPLYDGQNFVHARLIAAGKVHRSQRGIIPCVHTG